MSSNTLAELESSFDAMLLNELPMTLDDVGGTNTDIFMCSPTAQTVDNATKALSSTEQSSETPALCPHVHLPTVPVTVMFKLSIDFFSC